ncbi:transcription factor [Saccharomyces pastorianus]|uniref:Transcription factor n=1 Tax=Saccharomyces pastorianus TaxID=27292 RepID=A0A6C1EAB4_SACPS|nr:transcription factor [Saccharomyces pastorianus]
MVKRGDLQEGISSSEDAAKNRRKRRKPIKSCAFCRKRKLRCDQQKPMCLTCKSRGRPDCLYTQEFTHSIEPDELFGSTPNIELLQKVDELEKKLNGKGLERENVAEKRKTARNPYANLYHFQCRGSGRRIAYGPTSLRTYLFNDNVEFVKRYNQLRSRKVKIEINKWKAANTWTRMSEFGVLESTLVENNNSNVLKQICESLPSYEQTLNIITDFFCNERGTNDINQVLDKNKVINDFKSSFLPGNKLQSNGERPIETLLLSINKNYYKIGVILMILCICHFYENTPPEVEKYVVMLTGFTTAKASFIEHAQFILLRYHHRELFLACGDDSHMISLVDLLCSSAVTLGLHLDIREVYKDQENIVGSLKSLENLWIWILLSDFNVSLNVGRCLAISSSYFQADEYENDDDSHTKTVNGLPATLFGESDTCVSKIKRFLRLARPMVDEIYDKSCFPDLEKNCKILIDFVETEFAPISYFISSDLISKVPLGETKVLLQVLNLLLTFYSLRFLVSRERGVVLKNNILQTILVSFSVVINTTRMCFDLDKEHFPELFAPDCPNLSPFMALSLAYTNFLFPRASSVFCSFLYHNLTLFEKGHYLSSDNIDQNLADWDLSTLNIPLDKDINILSAFQTYSEIFDGWLNSNNQELRNIMCRSCTFVAIIAMESICRTVLKKVIECRTRVENSRLQQLHNINTPIDPSLNDLHVTTNNVPMGDAPAVLLPDAQNNNNTVNGGSTQQELTNKDNTDVQNNEAGLAQIISDEFWAAYNTGWEELMNQPDYKCLFDTH